MIYCWSNKWIHPYESSWSIIEKFKAANRITSFEFKKIFGLKNYKEQKNKSILGYGNYYTLSRFDNQKIIDVFGISLKEREEENMKLITSKLPIDNNYFRSNFTYCPECRNMSFHSIFHQFSFLQHCPYHSIPLIKKCIQCNENIPYTINSAKYAGVNKKCVCKINYLKITHFKYPPILNCYKLNYFLNINNSDLIRLKKIYFLPRQDFDKQPDIFDVVLSVIDHSFALPHFFYSKTADNISQLINLKDDWDIEYFSHKEKLNIDKNILQEKRNKAFKQSFDISIQEIINSLARHFRKKYLYNHRGCIKRITDSRNNEPFCPIALAYISWRQFAENLKEYYEVDNYEQPQKNYVYNYSYYNNASEILLHWSKQFDEGEKENRTGIKWLINKSIEQELIYQFKKLLKISNEYTDQKKIPSNFDYEIVQPQNYFCIFSNETNEPFEFIYWGESENFDDLIKSLRCPLNSIKRRRYPKCQRTMMTNRSRKRKEYIDHHYSLMEKFEVGINNLEKRHFGSYNN